MRGEAQVVSNRSESMAMEDHNGSNNEKMESVGSETEAYAIADEVAVSKLVQISKDQQRIFDANTDCCRLQRTSSFRNISKLKKLLPMEQPTRSSIHDMNETRCLHSPKP
ncbi:unnamed protein product [Musa acuminata var. zebrina]